MEVINIKLDQLKPYENNPRKNDKAVEAVAASIREFGFKVPIVVDSSNVIVCGHTRYKAAKMLGLESAPAILADDLTPEQIAAFRLADNKTAEIAEWDPELLISELANISEIDMLQFGFDADAVTNEETGEIIEDEYSDDAEPVTRPGDIWELDTHRLICGDAMRPDTMKKLLGKQPVDMVFTDPPYGYKYQSNGRTKSRKFEVIQNDDKILDFFPILKNRCSGFIWVCGTWKTADEWMRLFKQYFELTNVIIWDKGGGGIGDLYKTFSTDYEMIFVSNQGNEIRGRRFGSVWNFSDDEIKNMRKDELVRLIMNEREFSSIWREGKDNPNDYIHPTQKPVRLPARAIRASVEEGARVLDIFAGSGSTLMACEQTGRKFYGVEIDPHYCDIIVNRWESFTGKKAVRNGEETLEKPDKT